MEEQEAMNEKRKDYYRVFAPGVPNVRVVSERFTSEVAQTGTSAKF
jgi:hypothetical protein